MEKMVSKHSQMMESIRKLSDGLMELEAKLKVTQHKTHICLSLEVLMFYGPAAPESK